ncbi:MAG: DUF1819 family protein [Planctomycetes bacterium]|nr:DUF1819 family protein [Planctomycetota bacterium]
MPLKLSPEQREVVNRRRGRLQIPDRGGLRAIAAPPHQVALLKPTLTSYTSKIIKAGALLGDTKTLLAHWDLAASVAENLQRIRHENLFGKASRSRVEDILAIFRQRYLSEASVTRALVVLVSEKFPAASLDRILYFHAAQADRLLHDVVTEVLLPQNARGISDAHVREIQKVLATWVAEGKTSSHWSEATIRRVAQGLLSALRDFGVLQGAVNKRIAPAYLPVEAFAYVAFYLKQHQPSGRS